MTRDIIISRLYTSKNFNDAVNKVCAQPYWRDDLKAEVALIICEWDDDKILKLHADGALEFYVVRVLLNQIQSNTSPFYKKYRQTFAEIDKDTPGARVFENGEVSGEMMHAAFRDKMLKREGRMVSEDDEMEDRLVKEGLESVTMTIVDSWCQSKNNQLHYRGNLIKLYMQLGNFRAIQKATGIPFISCYKNIQQSIEMLRGMVLNAPVFTREELRQAATDVPKLKITL